MSAYTEDTVTGQYTAVTVYPPGNASGVPLAGVLTWRPALANPMTIEADTSGRQRLRPTGPYNVSMTMRRWVIRGNTLPAIFKMATDASGNYPWRKTLFNMEVDFLEQAATGITAGSGGWSLGNCVVTSWGVSLEDQYGFVFEDTTIIGLVLNEKDWG